MKKISFLFFLWVVIIYAFTFLSSSPAFFDYSYEATTIVREPFQRLWHLLNFDGGHYQNISHAGYIMKFQTAFFPLYPLSTKLLSFFTKNNLVSALLISLVCTYLSVTILFKSFKKPNSVITLIFFPLSFFFLAGYTESLFLLLSLLSWYFFRQKKYFYSGMLGFLASLSRFYGVLLFPSLLLEFFFRLPSSKRFKLSSYKPILPLLLIPLGLGSYMIYLKSSYQDPLSFIHSLALWNKSSITLPPQTVYRYFKMLTTVSPKIIQYWVALLELASLAFGLFVSFYFYKTKEFSYSLYVFLGSIIPAFTGTLQSLPRYLIVLFPIYFVNIPKKLKTPLLILSFSLQTLLLTAFLTGHFIA